MEPQGKFQFLDDELNKNFVKRFSRKTQSNDKINLFSAVICSENPLSH